MASAPWRRLQQKQNLREPETDAAETLEAITVTARRREESLQDTPVAITALSADALERQQIVSTTDLDKVAPNIQFHSYGTLTGNNSAAQVFIRGIGQTDATPAVDPGVGVYIDDVYMGRSVGAAMEFRDIANVQILRGPQGTLFGRNTIGGAVLLTTNEPGTDAGNSVRVGFGDDNLVEAFGAFDLPLGETFSARIALGMRQRDGYVKRVSDGKDLGDEDMATGAGRTALEAIRSFQSHDARRLHQGRRERLALRVPVDERSSHLRRCSEHRRRLS
jgi:iron complex outermembrane receptor protein